MEPTRSAAARHGRGRKERPCGSAGRGPGAESEVREHSVGESVKGVVGSFLLCCVKDPKGSVSNELISFPGAYVCPLGKSLEKG